MRKVKAASPLVCTSVTAGSPFLTIFKWALESSSWCREFIAPELGFPVRKAGLVGKSVFRPFLLQDWKQGVNMLELPLDQKATTFYYPVVEVILVTTNIMLSASSCIGLLCDNMSFDWSRRPTKIRTRACSVGLLWAICEVSSW